MTITPQELQSITKAYSILYVEDEPNLRTETTKLFTHLFKNVVTAADGQEGLDKYQAGNFDIVITDLSMPRMNGVAMVQAIKTIRPQQAVIIISAHDEANHLLPLIDAGVDKYILKPVNAKNLMDALYTVAMALHNEELVKQYRNELERQNEELIRNNDALKRLVRILDTKLRQNRPKTSQENSTLAPISLESIKSSEEMLGVFSTQLTQHPDAFFARIDSVGMALKNYGTFFDSNSSFDALGGYFIQLGGALLRHAPLARTMELQTLFESFFYVWERWSASYHEEGIDASRTYDSSLINDIETLLIALEKSSQHG